MKSTIYFNLQYILKVNWNIYIRKNYINLQVKSHLFLMVDLHWIIRGRRGSSSVHAYQGTWWRTRVSFGTTGNVTINLIKGLRGLEQNVITHHTWWEKWVLRVYACVHRCNTVTKSRNIVRKIFDSQNIDFIPVKIIAFTTSMFLFCNVVLWKTFILLNSSWCFIKNIDLL